MDKTRRKCIDVTKKMHRQDVDKTWRKCVDATWRKCAGKIVDKM